MGSTTRNEFARREHKENGLAGVGGTMVVAQQAAAGSQDHRAVPRHDRRKRRLRLCPVAALQEPCDELGIG